MIIRHDTSYFMLKAWLGCDRDLALGEIELREGYLYDLQGTGLEGCLSF